jgi:hypothetical protein
MNTLNLIIAIAFSATFSFAGCKKPKNNLTKKPIVVENTKIQVALLLDTSNSMDGLIEQAKSRLWNIVNTLTTLKYDGKTPDIEISLYEYGNDRLSAESNYINQIVPLSTDLDLISEKLFSLSTNGGEEYCGAVIQDATKKLTWGKDNNNMKLIYICGNEAFNQGRISYKEAIANAKKNNIYINTIFCGNQKEGVDTFWKNGADIGNGKFFNIDSDKIIQYVETPYDDKITKCNERINATYINYGTQGRMKKENQKTQDDNAMKVSKANMTERSVSKSKGVYKNETWDLVDKMKKDKNAVANAKKEDLPAEYQNKTSAELVKIVEEKTVERENIQKEISELAKKRQEFIDVESKKTKTVDDLGNSISNSILTFAKAKGYSVLK